MVNKSAATGRGNGTVYQYVLIKGIWIGKVALWGGQEERLCYGGLDAKVHMALPGRKECPVRGWKWSLDIR